MTGQDLDQPRGKLTGRTSFLLKNQTSLCWEVSWFVFTASRWYSSRCFPGGWSPYEYFLSIDYISCNTCMHYKIIAIFTVLVWQYRTQNLTLSRKAPLTWQNCDQKPRFLKGTILLKSHFGSENWLALIKPITLLQREITRRWPYFNGHLSVNGETCEMREQKGTCCYLPTCLPTEGRNPAREHLVRYRNITCHFIFLFYWFQVFKILEWRSPKWLGLKIVNVINAFWILFNNQSNCNTIQG